MAEKSLWEYLLGKKKEEPEKDDSDSGSGSGSGRVGSSGDSGQRTTYLLEETEWMAYERRALEQQVERLLAQVEERKKPQRQQGNEAGVEQRMKQHPLLDSQRFDGIDPSLNPAPFGLQEAEIAFENAQREQQQEQQLRLGLAPQMGKNNVPELKVR